MKVYLCAISNIESGTCNEDCKFCTQSVKYKTDIQRYKQKPIKDIIKEAQKAKQNKAVGFCLVTAGKGLDDKKTEWISEIAYEINKQVDISLIACNGIATKEQLSELKKNGIKHYNHNLETSKEFYKNICTTHSWEERYQTCINVKEIGLNLCTGGIFGLGESEEDRYSFIKSLKELNPNSIPINFFHPNPKLPLENKIIDKKEAIKWIKILRDNFKTQLIMVAGGRELVFQDDLESIFKAGANSIVIGDYLTTKGANIIKDLQKLKNYEIARDC